MLQGFCPYGFAAALRAASWSLKRSRRGDRERRKLLDDALSCAAMGKLGLTSSRVLEGVFCFLLLFFFFFFGGGGGVWGLLRF